MLRHECIDDHFIFFAQKTAGCIHQTPAGFHQPRGRGEDGSLLLIQFSKPRFMLAIFQIRVAPQRAQAGARRVDQHPVNLAGEALDARVVLADDALRRDIGKTGPLQARPQVAEALLGNIERIDAPGRGHRGGNQQRLAAGASAKIDHHLAAPRLEQQAQQLAAFILHLNKPFDKRRMLRQRNLAFQAYTQWGKRRRGAFDALLGKACEYGIAFGLEGIDAQIERCSIHHAAAKRNDFFAAHQCFKTRDHPVRQFSFDAQRQTDRRGRFDRRQPLVFARAQQGREFALAQALHAHQRQQGQIARLAVRHQMLERAPMAQHRVNRLGDNAAIAMPQFRMLAKKIFEADVGGRSQRQDDGECFNQGVEQRGGDLGGRGHWEIIAQAAGRMKTKALKAFKVLMRDG